MSANRLLPELIRPDGLSCHVIALITRLLPLMQKYLLSFLMLSVGVIVQAESKFDLERVVPVPANEPIPTYDFFRPRILTQPELNSSGTHILARITAGEDKHLLMVYDIKTQKIESISWPGDIDIYYAKWLNDSRLIFGLSAQKLYGLGLMATNVGKFDFPYPILQYAGSSLVSIRLKNRLEPLVWIRGDIDSYKDQGVCSVNTTLNSGKVSDLSHRNANRAHRNDTYEQAMAALKNNERHYKEFYELPSVGVTFGYLSDKEGELAYAYTFQKEKLQFQRLEGKKWIMTPVDLEDVDVVGAGNAAGQVFIEGPHLPDKPRALQLMTPATGELGEVVLQDKAYDFTGWLYRHPGTGDVLGAIFHRDGPRTVWFSEEYRGLQKVLDRMFPGLVVQLHGSDVEQRIFLVSTYSDKQPVIYHWVNLETRDAGMFKNSAPWIDPQRMQPMNIIKFKTRDGRQLDAYLTLPAGATKANPVPLVVLCHGGPWVRDTWGFDGEVQFLAAHGYAVLQPNYRGSTGYNWMFPREDEWNFVKMQEDVTDATKMVMTSGLIDQDRIAIMGASFGGYLAVAGVAHEPSLYRCAVTIAGVFDWELKVLGEKSGQFDVPYYARMIKKLGNPKNEKEKFFVMSPINFIQNIRVPVFVAAGKEDWTVEIEQSERLISALKKHDVPYEKLFISDEAHGMAHLKNEVELYDRILVFLAKNLTPKK